MSQPGLWAYIQNYSIAYLELERISSKEATEDYKTLFDSSPISEDLIEYLSKLDVRHRNLFLEANLQ